MGSAALYWCPSDGKDKKPDSGQNIGLCDSCFKCNASCPGKNVAGCGSPNNCDNAYAGSYYGDACNWPPFTSGLPCSGWLKMCQKSGMGAADDISYAFVGGRLISSTEWRSSAEARLAGDNEEEGDEKPCMNSGWDLSGGGCSWATGGCRDRLHNLHGDMSGWIAPGYRYVGGLESKDNHAQDGVNVLYLDWHAEFDGRSWPTPLGTTDFEWDGNHSRCEWGDPVSGCGETCQAEQFNRNATCTSPGSTSKPKWCNGPYNQVSARNNANADCPW